MGETLESVFSDLPKGCWLRAPNSYNSKYSAGIGHHTRVIGDTPKEAVIKLAELLAQQRNNLNKLGDIL